LTLLWLAMLVCAGGAALVLWHEVSRNVHCGTQMLKQYEALLARAREEKTRDGGAGGDKPGAGAARK
jgi:hypothetical protein